jgi:hypothetical protein
MVIRHKTSVISHVKKIIGAEKSYVDSYGSFVLGFFREFYLYFRNDPNFSLDNYGSYERK